MKKGFFLGVLITVYSVSGYTSTQCQGSDGKWYPYKSPYCDSSIPFCKESIDSLINVKSAGLDWIKELARRCPGAKLRSDNTIVVWSNGQSHTFELNFNDTKNEHQEQVQQEKILNQYQSFSFDGFQWQLLDVKRFDKLGSETNPQLPSNGSYLVVEFQITNISNKPRYLGRMLLLANGTQYPSSSKSVYGSYQLGYDNNDSTKIEPTISLKSYVVFDTNFTNQSILLIKEWSGDNRVKVSISG